MDELIKNSKSRAIRMNYDSLFSSYEIPVTNGEEDEEEKGQVVRYTADEVESLIEEQRKEWISEYEKRMEAAIERSFSKGLSKGREEEKERFDTGSETLSVAFNEVSKKLDELTEKLKPQISSMIFDLAGQILEQPVKNRRMREQIARQLEEVVGQLQRDMDIRIEVSDTDYEIVEQMLDTKFKNDRIFISPSGDLNPGEFRVETSNELVVKQFSELLAGFRDSVTFSIGDEG